jgi:hypothetical protein
MAVITDAQLLALLNLADQHDALADQYQADAEEFGMFGETSIGFHAHRSFAEQIRRILQVSRGEC